MNYDTTEWRKFTYDTNAWSFDNNKDDNSNTNIGDKMAIKLCGDSPSDNNDTGFSWLQKSNDNNTFSWGSSNNNNNNNNFINNDILACGCNSNTDNHHNSNKYNNNTSICDLLMCKHLQSLQTIMINYKVNKYSLLNTDIDHIQQHLNHYFHLITQHSTDDEFETIYNRFGGNCNLEECVAFKRNHRNRDRNNDCFNIDANIQILDIIHCHYSHCFDHGYKLNKTQRESISRNHNDDEYFINNRLIQTQKILSNKHNLQNNFRSHKYSTLHQDGSNYKYYDFGVLFDYGNDMKNFQLEDDMMIPGYYVRAMYTNLKEELIVNSINIKQFANEYQKALKYYLSHYCKQFIQCYQKRVEQRRDGSGYTHKIQPGETARCLSINHLLAIMFYCNYDVLSYKFSETYRKICADEKIESILSRHRNYYWLAMYLTEAVNWFGVPIGEGEVDTFYHGISEELLLPHLVTHTVIQCPFSTSSSLEVALRFTNHNKGVIVQLNKKDMSTARYLSCNWLSDFSNESECLFVQSDAALPITNIIRVKSGVEYSMILRPLKYFPYRSYGRDDNDLKLLTKKLIHHRLSFVVNTYEAFKSLDKYGEKILQTHCVQKLTFYIPHMDTFVEHWPELCYSNHKWIKIDIVILLYPNVKEIIIDNKSFSMSGGYINFALNNMLCYLCAQPVNKLELIKVEICCAEKIWNDTCDRYKPKFLQHGWELKRNHSTVTLIACEHRSKFIWQNGIGWCRRLFKFGPP
eukprot:6190_1